MYCPKCGRENLAKNKFCNGCGVVLLVQPVAPSPIVPPPPPTPVDWPAEPSPPILEYPDTTAANEADSRERTIQISEIDKELTVNEDFREEEDSQEMRRVFEEAESRFDELFPSGESANIKEPPSAELLFAQNDELEVTAVAPEPPPLPAHPPDQDDESEMTAAAPAPPRDIPLRLAIDELIAAPQTSAGDRSPPGGRGKMAAVIGISVGVLILISGAIFGILYFRSSNGLSANRSVNTNANSVETAPNSPPPGMAFVPGGEFMMGSDKDDEYSRPAHKVTVKSFFIDLTEVTNEEYKTFVDATNHTPPPRWRNGIFADGKANFPVTGVNWDDANTYAKWANKRLPTEEEWEFAARGTTGYLYPWGNEWKPGNANAASQAKGLQEVGREAGKSPFGVMDMSGNAWEWTTSDASAYPGGKSFSGNYINPKIIRGGFWDGTPETVTTIYRRAYGAVAEKKYVNTGIRCVKNSEEK